MLFSIEKTIPFFISFFLSFSCFSQSPWYHHSSIYQIYPRSFYDSNGDGIGDLEGVIHQLDYIHELGFDAIWISPFFQSPQKDFGYDISAYQSIATEYGDMKIVEKLIDETHKRGMKLVFDLVMNHTSDQHPWFLQDLKKSITDDAFYVWRNKKNNWKSMVTGSAWHYQSDRKQYYYAAFLPFQPDLNYRNPMVKKEMLNVARYWLAKGVDGFRLDIFNSIYEDSLFRNNPTIFSRKRTSNQCESLKFAEELRSLCDSFGEKILLGEIAGNRAASKLYCGEKTNNRLGLAFDFEMLRFHFRAGYFQKLLKNLELDFSSPFMPVYVFSNHDRRRMISRLKGNEQKAILIHFLQHSVRGVSCNYYGEEIGMTDLALPYKKAKDPIPDFIKLPRGIVEWANETLNRDDVRTPMQWNSLPNSGFTTADSSWLRVNSNYILKNVTTEKKDSLSYYNLFKRILTMKKNDPIWTNGSMELAEIKSKNGLLFFKRKLDSKEVQIIINFTKHSKKIKLNGKQLQFDLNQNSKIIQNKDLILNKYNAIVLN